MAESQEALELVKVCGPVEAEMIQEMLQNNGIECSLQGEASALTLPATGDLDEVRIFVKAEDAEEAGEVINAFFETSVDDSQTEPS